MYNIEKIKKVCDFIIKYTKLEDWTKYNNTARANYIYEKYNLKLQLICENENISCIINDKYCFYLGFYTLQNIKCFNFIEFVMLLEDNLN